VRLTEPGGGRHTDSAHLEAGADEADLLLGIEDGLDPRPADDGAGPDGDVVTGPSSWWNHRLCKTCGHSFRRGDRVRIDRGARAVVHLDLALDCAVTEQKEAESAARQGDLETAALSEGLLAAWPPQVPVTRIPLGDWRLPNPATGLPAPVCLYCGHTFRAGEYVVVCPCQPEQMACGAAVHRDPAAGLSCWERWRPAGRVTVCPVTLAKVRSRPS